MYKDEHVTSAQAKLTVFSCWITDICSLSESPLVVCLIDCVCPLNVSIKDKNSSAALQRMHQPLSGILFAVSFTNTLYWKKHYTCDKRMCSSWVRKNTWGLSVMFYGKCITSVLSHQCCAPPHCWSFEPTEEPLGLYCTLRLCLLGKQTKYHVSLLTKGRKPLCNRTEQHKSWILNTNTIQRKSLYNNVI